MRLSSQEFVKFAKVGQLNCVGQFAIRSQFTGVLRTGKAPKIKGLHTILLNTLSLSLYISIFTCFHPWWCPLETPCELRTKHNNPPARTAASPRPGSPATPGEPTTATTIESRKDYVPPHLDP